MSDSWQVHYRMFALYNRWANARLYQVAQKCSAEELSRDRGAFFKSILGTLNHLVVTDRMWLGRMRGQSPLGVKLDDAPYDDIAALMEARQKLDKEIIDHILSLSDTDILGPLEYQTSSGAPQSQPLNQVLAHFFNHQTHHRGQAHDLLTQALSASEAPVLDLVYYQRAVASNDVP